MKHFLVTLLFIITPLSSIADEVVFRYESTNELIKPINLSHIFAQKRAYKLERGSLTLRLRNHISEGKTTFLGISDPQKNKYVNFYVNRTSAGLDIFGIEIRNQGKVTENRHLVTVDGYADDPFKTITYTFVDKKNQIHLYIDGIKKHVDQHSTFLADITGLSHAYLGKTAHQNLPTWQFLGDVYYAEFTANVLSAKTILKKHQQLRQQHDQALKQDKQKRLKKGAYQSEKQTLFVEGQGGARSYRFPSLLTTQNNVVIAAIDKRNQHSSDWGNIDTVIRRSIDNGKTWLEDQVILNLPAQPYGTQNSAFSIDPLLVQDKKSGRIFMLIDMFPESKGFFSLTPEKSEGSGYQQIDDQFYRTLTDNDENIYTVRENGNVYNDDDEPTEYHVITQGNPLAAFKDLGDLYRYNQRVGNIFLNSSRKNNDSAPLQAKLTSYLWLMYSDDDGKTWSNPVDITPQIKEDWMLFLGTGPGNGIQLKNGALVMPIYYTNQHNKQSATVIISHDNGKTWIRGESPNDSALADDGGSESLNDKAFELTESQLIELNNGVLKMFSRNQTGNVRISTSQDGGYTWLADTVFDDVLLDPYSQLSVIKYSKLINGKEYVIFANPHSDTNKRVNGKVWIGEVQPDSTILWKYTTTIEAGSYAYNSLTELPNGDIGLLYEESPSKIQYISFNIQTLLWRESNTIHQQ